MTQTGMPAHRPIVMTTAGAVVSGHHKASEAGAAVLRDGGNAMDAAVAASAALCVAIPHMNGLGGDCIALYFEAATGKVTAINGSGRAPASTSADIIRTAGHSNMPMRGPLAISVPGLVSAWETCLARFGTQPLGALLTPAGKLAADGIPIDTVLAQFLAGAVYRDLVASYPALASLYGAPGGRRLGELIRNPKLSETIAAIARRGAAAFYRGDITEMLVSDLRAAGAPITTDDFHRHETRFDAPLSVAIAGRRLHAAPPNAQGLALAVMAGLYNRDLRPGGALPRMDPTQFLSRKAIAFKMRGERVDDPDVIDRPDDVLTLENLAKLHAGLDEATRAHAAHRPAGDTSTLVVVDRWGNAVSWVQSLFEEFGSGIVSGSTGVVLHNRLGLQSLSPGQPWPLRPGHRPFNTLCPALLERDGRCELALATPGDHGQPQTIMQVLLRMFGENLDIQAAIEAPRLRHDAGSDVMVESRAPAAWRDEIAAGGLTVRDVGPWSRLMGGVNGLHRQDEGLLFAGADPRRACYAVTAD